MANQTKPHRYLVVLDIESPESISDAELLAELNGEQWMGSPPWRVVVAATVLSRTADAADVATNVAEDPRTWPHSFVGYQLARQLRRELHRRPAQSGLFPRHGAELQHLALRGGRCSRRDDWKPSMCSRVM